MNADGSSIVDDLIIQINHQEMVAALAKPGAEILEGLSGADWSLLDEVTTEGIYAGNRLDMAKKQVIYNKHRALQPEFHAEYPKNLTPEKCHLLHMALGIFGEAAELLEAVYGHVSNNQPLDTENCIEEAGDIEFYVEGFLQGLGRTREDVLELNVEKLSKRYEGLKYSDNAAQTRADKTTEPVSEDAA